MTRVNFVVEGQTEETFVRDVLSPYLSTRGVYPVARSVETGRQGAKIFRGGIVSYSKAKSDIIRWLKQDTDAYVTTMFDYYALPNDFPSFDDAKIASDIYQKAEKIENAMGTDISNIKFIPYIQMHEFEAILFSNINKIDNCMGLYNEFWQT